MPMAVFNRTFTTKATSLEAEKAWELLRQANGITFYGNWKKNAIASEGVLFDKAGKFLV